jgi:hypothetical protein
MEFIIEVSENVWIRTTEIGGEYSFDNINWNFITSGPVKIINKSINNVNVFFYNSIDLPNEFSYFICGSDNITFDSESGTICQINVNEVFNYPGFINNGSISTDGYKNIIVKNLFINNNSSFLDTNAGWIGQSFFGKAGSGQIINCSSNGSINNSGCGGILGGGSANSSFENGVIVDNCSSTGSITGPSAGGIVGIGGGLNGGLITVLNSYSTGNILGSGAGGIFGGSGGDSGIAIAENCYSTGGIGEDAGGIFGTQSGEDSGRASAFNCYSSGVIIGKNAGGIFGSKSAITSGFTKASNCYTTGALTGLDTGGIYGNFFNSSSSEAENCYTSGIGGVVGGIYAGNSSDNPFGDKGNYSELNNEGEGWTLINAKNTLLNTPNYNSSNQIVNRVGTVWTDISVNPLEPNEPWLLTQIGYSPYTLSLQRTFSSSIQSGESTNPVVNTFYTSYSILSINNQLPSIFNQININSSNGSILTTSTLPEGIYNLWILSSINPYSITEYQLNVSNIFICYNEGTTVLTQINNNLQYKKIQDLRPNDLIQTYKHGLLPIKQIGKRIIRNGKTPLNSMYKIAKHGNLTEDLIVSGSHNILIDNYPKNHKIIKNNPYSRIDGKVRILASNYPNSQQLKDNNEYTLYHIVLGGENPRYGIYVNGGLLSESTTMWDFKKFGFIPLN